MNSTILPTPKTVSRKIWSIAAEDDFIAALADGLWARFGGGADGFALNDVTVLLPTRRACRALRAGFLRRGDGAVVLLPRLMPLGDLDQDALFFSAEDVAGADFLNLPPPIAPLARQWELARLLALADPDTPTPQRFRLAGELGRLLDQWQTEGLDTSLLAGLPDERFAEHWQKTLTILAVILEHWPAMLGERGMVDPARHRNLLMAAQAALWRQNPPSGPPSKPVIAAGSTGSLPATAALLAVIADLPGGEIVLPGLDPHLAEAAWRVIEEPHPQFMLKKCLDHLGVARQDVMPWPGRPPVIPNQVAPRVDRTMRMQLLSLAMMPAATGELWHQAAKTPLRGVTRIDAATAEEEALVIAIILRKTLEEGDKTAALVTPDRLLARRVAAMMGRWSLVVDDSAGMPLSETALGSWLRQTARLALVPDARRRAVDVLGLLKHPLAGLGRSASDRLRLVRLLEQKILRGPAAPPGWAGLRQHIQHIFAERPEVKGSGADPQTEIDLLDLVDDLAAAFAGLETMRGQRVAALDLLDAHGALVEKLATTDQQPGAARCWQGAAGEAAAGFFSDLRLAAANHPPIHAGDYADLLDDGLLAVPVRQIYGADPRLGIWGPLEARLQQADVMILGGLNEGVWPGDPPPDAWLSRPMRRALNLPTPERRIGQSAHDFIAACGASEVFFTRAERQGGSPTVPSRWLQRLDGVLRVLVPGQDVWQGGQHLWLKRARGLDFAVDVKPVARPAPVPPLALRPATLRITDVEKLLADPYDFYARRILRLEPMQPLETPPGAAERGSIIHAALHQVLADWKPGTDWPDDMAEKLRIIGKKLFDALGDHPVIGAFWWPRFEQIIRDFDQWQRQDGAAWCPVALETAGQIERRHGDHRLTLIGRADRIDQHRDNPFEARILDYKTGAVPSEKAVKSGTNPQLALTGLMVQQGGFSALPGDWQVGSIGYLGMGHRFEHRGFAKLTPADLIDEADDGLDHIISTLFDPAFAFAATGAGHGDYHHLARLAEWAVEGNEDDGEGES